MDAHLGCFLPKKLDWLIDDFSCQQVNIVPIEHYGKHRIQPRKPCIYSKYPHVDIFSQNWDIFINQKIT